MLGSATDTDGTVTGYLWTKLSGPSGPVITSPTSPTTTITGLTPGTYVYQLQATDNNGATGVDNVTILVTANQNPVANAGVDKNITLPTNTVSVTGSGTDSDGSIVSYLWTKVSGPSTFTIASPTSATTNINNLVQGTYVFQLQVTDNLGGTGTDTMTVVVNPVPNLAPTANADTDKVITLPTASVTLTGSGTDPDGTIASYAWTKVSGPATFTIVSPTAATTVVNNLVAGTYVFKLTVTDNGGLTGTDTVQVIVNPAPNVLPVANAGIDQVITLPTNSVTVNGSGSTDSDGTIVSYLWNKFTGSGGVVTSPTSASTTITGLIEGSYVFQLTVTDNSGGQSTDMINITVLPAVPPPPVAKIALASAPTTPVTSTNVTLPLNSVSLVDASTSPGYSIVSWAWTKISGPAPSVITSPFSSATTITGLVQGTYVFQLQVWIGAPYNLSGTTTITVTVSNGRVFYISPSGSNSNTFTQAQNAATPWKTLAYAGSVLNTAGDIIHVLPGTYNETQPCILKPGVSIEGEGVTSNIVSTYAGAIIQLISATDGTNGNQSVSKIKLSGSNWTGYVGIDCNRSNVKVHTCTIERFRNDGVRFTSSSVPTSYITGCEMYNCILNDNSSRATGQGSLVATGFDGISIYNNTFNQTGRAAGSNGNTFSQTTNFYNKGFKFYGNKSYRNEDEGTEWSFHLELWDCQGGYEIYNNEFYGGHQQIDFGGNDATKGTYAYAADIHDNLFQFDTPVVTTAQYQDIGINIEGNSEYVIIRNNHFKNVPYAVQITTGHSSIGISNITIQNNLFENSGYTNNEWGFDIAVLCEPGQGSVNNLYVYNNTMVGSNHQAALFSYVNTGRTLTNVKFINNIVRDTRSGYLSFDGTPGTKTGWVVRNNNLYLNANSNAPTYAASSTQPTGWTYTGNIVGNPLLDSNFYLTASSPGVNAAFSVGLPYCQTAPDIGWKEYCP